jgi:hypothetical protein
MIHWIQSFPPHVWLAVAAIPTYFFGYYTGKSDSTYVRNPTTEILERRRWITTMAFISMTVIALAVGAAVGASWRHVAVDCQRSTSIDIPECHDYILKCDAGIYECH